MGRSAAAGLIRVGRCSLTAAHAPYALTSSRSAMIRRLFHSTTVHVLDVLWVWGSGGSGWSVTSTGAQSTTSPAALTRPDANGKNTELWMETLAAGGAASGTSTITYTNSGGTGSRSASLRDSKLSSPIIGSMEPYALAAGDDGVQSVQSMTNSATWTIGTFRLCIVREVAAFGCQANQPITEDAYSLGLPRVYDSAALMVTFTPNSTTTGPLNLTLSLVQG